MPRNLKVYNLTGDGNATFQNKNPFETNCFAKVVCFESPVGQKS